MKIIKFIFLSLLATVLLSACAKHDFFDENTLTGKVGPMAIWDLESATVNAGASMGFTAQYYSEAANISHSEVWYNLTETEERTVTCPWIAASRTFSIGAIKTEEKRIFEKIWEYPHALAVKSKERRAYILTDKFPVSNTLGSLAWLNPETFGEEEYEKMEKYFAPGYMKLFKDSLERSMTWDDYNSMLVGLEKITKADFRLYTDSTKIESSGTWVKHFPKEYPEQPVREIPVPAAIKNLYDEIPFKDLIGKSSVYNVVYKRNYTIKAVLRVYDERGVYSITEAKSIEIN